jgi:predicted Zn-dependent protease
MKWIRLGLFLTFVTVLTCAIYQQVKAGWILFRQGEGLYEQGDMVGALPLFEAAEQAGVPSRELLLKITETRLFLGQTDVAGQAFAKAFRQRWFRPYAADALIELFLRFQAGTVALEVIRLEVARHPDSKVLRLYYGRLLSRLGQFADAAKEFRIMLGEPVS